MYEEKLRPLLASDNIENVHLAFSLIDTLDDKEYMMLASYMDIDEEGKVSCAENWPFAEYISIYMLGLLGRRGDPKVLEIR